MAAFVEKRKPEVQAQVDGRRLTPLAATGLTLESTQSIHRLAGGIPARPIRASQESDSWPTPHRPRRPRARACAAPRSTSRGASRLKSYVRKVEEALASGDKAAAKAALAAAEPILMRTAQKGVIHKKAAARKVSRLAARVKAMA